MVWWCVCVWLIIYSCSISSPCGSLTGCHCCFCVSLLCVRVWVCVFVYSCLMQSLSRFFWIQPYLSWECFTSLWYWRRHSLNVDTHIWFYSLRTMNVCRKIISIPPIIVWFQSGPSQWTSQPTDIAIRRAMLLEWLKTNILQHGLS